ncbi:Methyltransferase-related protein [Striga hermonthica]|uniref:Methyltransferase-related protein n=1 Tax=Striga hermonthica TaxID=68872 RepID=A0A9N7RQP0_STRHE|nr:Methyltransferase-related protein [Striga hermonthica]
MCPLRFLLVFFSAVLAAYFAWKTVSPSDEPDIITTPDDENSTIEKHEFHFLKMMQKGFFVFIDMASGRYLWKKVKQLSNNSNQHVD